MVSSQVVLSGHHRLTCCEWQKELGSHHGCTQLQKGPHSGENLTDKLPRLWVRIKRASISLDKEQFTNLTNAVLQNPNLSCQYMARHWLVAVTCLPLNCNSTSRGFQCTQPQRSQHCLGTQQANLPIESQSVRTPSCIPSYRRSNIGLQKQPSMELFVAIMHRFRVTHRQEHFSHVLLD